MARIRSIKPEVHLDVDLWDLEQETGLPIFRAFTALWGQADREGRFKWEPRQLKTQCLPYWEGDFSRVLDALTTRGFLVRYACGTGAYGLVRTFTKHQIVNHKEAASVLPAPECECNDSKDLTREARVNHATTTREPRVPGGKEGKGKEGEGAATQATPPPTRPVPEPTDDEFGDDATAYARLEPWAVLWRIWVEVALGGIPAGDWSAHKRPLTRAWADCEAREPGAPGDLFERAATAYVSDCVRRDRRATLRFFLVDLGEWIAEPDAAPVGRPAPTNVLNYDHEDDDEAAE